MPEFLYFSVLDDGERFEFISVDTLTHPLDFLDAIARLRLEHKAIASDRNLNLTEVYGCFGYEDEVMYFEDSALDDAYGFRFYDKEAQCAQHVDEEYASQIRNAFVAIMRRSPLDSKMRVCRKMDEEMGFQLLLITSGDAFLTAEHCKIALGQYADQWIHQEMPFMLKRQVFINASMLNGIRGKRIIAPHYNAETERWELLLEGA